MDENEIFPLLHDGSSKDEPWDHRFAPLAGHLGCSIDQVAQAFIGLEFPEYARSEHLDIVHSRVRTLNRAAAKAQDLLLELGDLPADAWEYLLFRGTVTLQQVEYLADALNNNGASLNDWYSGKNRRGGRNVAAYVVAEGTRRAFRRCRASITFGEADGHPSTAFGRAVEDTIAAFGIRSNWKGPTKEAWSKQRSIEQRLGRVHAYLTQRKNIAGKYPELDWDLVSFQTQGRDIQPGRVLIRLRDNSSHPYLTVDRKDFFKATDAALRKVQHWYLSARTHR